MTSEKKRCHAFNPPCDGMWSVCADCGGDAESHRGDRPTLRDYFAAKALAGAMTWDFQTLSVAATSDEIERLMDGKQSASDLANLLRARVAYAQADAMLKARGAR